MKGNRFTGWSDEAINRYIRTKQSIHATTCGFWGGLCVAVPFAWNNPNDAGDFVFAAVAVTAGVLCWRGVEKSKKEIESIELEQNRRRDKIESGDYWDA
jgi:hypothetical protein